MLILFDVINFILSLTSYHGSLISALPFYLTQICRNISRMLIETVNRRRHYGEERGKFAKVARNLLFKCHICVNIFDGKFDLLLVLDHGKHLRAP